MVLDVLFRRTKFSLKGKSSLNLDIRLRTSAGFRGTDFELIVNRIAHQTETLKLLRIGLVSLSVLTKALKANPIV